jgi:hypothetical protein
MVATMTERLTEAFDEECRFLQIAGPVPPGDVRQAVQQVLDSVSARLADDQDARLAVESVRANLSILDAVRLVYPAIPQARQERSAGRFRNMLSRNDEPPVLPPKVMIESGQVVDATRNALESVDLLRANEPPPPEVVIRPWAEDSELLGLFSDLFAAARRTDPEYLLARIAQLADDLALRHEIEVVEFDEAGAGQFEVAPSVNPDDTGTRTVRPALVRHGLVLRAGEARTPKPEEGGSNGQE